MFYFYYNKLVIIPYLRDIPMGINHHKLLPNDELYNTLGNYRIGDNVILTLIRDSKEKKIRNQLKGID